MVACLHDSRGLTTTTDDDAIVSYEYMMYGQSENQHTLQEPPWVTVMIIVYEYEYSQRVSHESTSTSSTGDITKLHLQVQALQRCLSEALASLGRRLDEPRFSPLPATAPCSRLSRSRPTTTCRLISSTPSVGFFFFLLFFFSSCESSCDYMYSAS